MFSSEEETEAEKEARLKAELLARLQTTPSPVIGTPIGTPQPMPVVEEPTKEDELAELLAVPQPDDNDIVTDHLVDISEEDIYGGDPDMSDLTDVTQEDLFGTPPAVEQARRRIKRTAKRYSTPPTSLRGVR